MKRHRWVRLREHVYICRDCGTGRVNAQTVSGYWFTTWHRPNGQTIVDTKVPPCAVGHRTAAALRKHIGTITGASENATSR